MDSVRAMVGAGVMVGADVMVDVRANPTRFLRPPRRVSSIFSLELRRLRVSLAVQLTSTRATSINFVCIVSSNSAE